MAVTYTINARRSSPALDRPYGHTLNVLVVPNDLPAALRRLAPPNPASANAIQARWNNLHIGASQRRDRPCNAPRHEKRTSVQCKAKEI